jgi:hypothetical protein
VSDSGVSNEAISDLSRDTLEQLVGEDVGDIFQDGVMTSLLVTGALQARAVLAGRTLDVSQVRSTLELVGIGAATAVTVQALLHLI